MPAVTDSTCVYNTPASLRPTGPVRRHTVPISAAESVVRRNRLPSNQLAKLRKLWLAPATSEAFTEAAKASGNLSLSLYVERLRSLLEAEGGALPVLDDASEVRLKL